MNILSASKNFAFACGFLLISHAGNAQTGPTAYLSRNTVISLLQDRMVKNYMDPALKKYIWCAPSYCFVNDFTIGFTQLVTSQDIDHSKIGLTTYCGDLNALKLSLAAVVHGSYMILSGTATVTDSSIVVSLTDAYGSSEVLNNLGKAMLASKPAGWISLKQLSLLYDKQNYDNLGTRARFTKDGLVVGVNAADISLVDPDELSKINTELQSTGVTSIGVFLPLDFVNKQFENISIPYNDGKGTDITLTKCQFVVQSGSLQFNTVLSGNSIKGTALRNTYNVNAVFNNDDMTLKSFKSTMNTGADANEAAQVRIIVNYLENEYRDKLIFALPNQQYYNINGADTHIQLNVKTYYGHFANGIIAFINSFNVKK